MLHSLHQQKLLQNLRFRQSSTVASIVVLLYEYIITFRKELRYIWRRPFKLNKAIYLFARYFGIIVQSINTYLALGPHAGLSIDERACKRWQLFQASSAYVLSGTLHFILMLMVYALHLKDWKIGIFLAFLYLPKSRCRFLSHLKLY
ncbi:hypothetical protein CPB84DRAFT_1491767 [Gymnopilus junonius]|uniref:DUF6533 domain-containing protein n=1 Tax=Gymnopilus junonius TaxID=109634 RepID=A0A9P5NHY3_GYMJU|nr:hypothetical protein CPB84DRAFT_1491767 [Gymnopilus junonius]